MRVWYVMKILVVCQYYHPEPFRITDICETLVTMGHEVTVLTGLPNYPEGVVPNEYKRNKKRHEVINGVSVIRTYEKGRGKGKVNLFLNYLSFAISGSLKSLTIKEKFDVILVNQLSPVLMGIPAMILKRRSHKRVLFYCLDLWPASLAAGGVKKESFLYRIFLRISKSIYRSADEILITSKTFLNYFRDELEINDVPISYLPQYAEDLFTDIKPSQKEKNTVDLVFAGNIGEMQSVDTIIKAANMLKDEHKIHFHIVGDGSKLDECKKLGEQFELCNLTFYGRRPLEEMKIFYDMADAMLLTLSDDKILSYTLPGKVQTYMAAGKPILGAINGEANRVIDESKCGIVCEAEDYQTYAKNIVKFSILGDKSFYAHNSRNYYQNEFSKSIILKRLEEKLKYVGGISNV